MALINYANKEINAKIVYYGPGLSGKTTNIQYIYQRLRPEHRGKLITLPTQTDRTLFFDFLPVEIPNVKGFTTRFHLYTVPGQVFYNATRKMVLKGADGIVFVADSQKEKFRDNIESLRNLEDNLREYGKSIEILPLVFQFNKRDLSEISTVEEINKGINTKGYSYFEAIATQGKGVMETLSAISKTVLKHLKESYESQRIIRYGEETDEVANKGKRDRVMVEVEDSKEESEVFGKPDVDIVETEEMDTISEEEIDRTVDELGVMGEYDEGLETPKEADDVYEEVEVEVDSQGIKEVGAAVDIEVYDNDKGVDLVLGGEVEKTGPASFRLPLTFRINDIKKDLVLNINFQITESDKERDIF